MNNIIRHTEYLISRNDCVIIPGIGAVLASMESAHFNADSGMFMPPHRVFGFNSGLTRNDGILTHSISRAEGISYQAADRIVADEAEAMMHQLKKEGELSLGKIGILLYHRATDSISFDPFDSDRLSVATMWLAPVDAYLAKSETDVPVIEPIILKAPLQPWKRAIRIAASIAVLIGICFVSSTPISVDDAMLASLSPDLREVSAAEMMPSATEVPLTIIKGPTDPNFGYLWHIYEVYKQQKQEKKEKAEKEALEAKEAEAKTIAAQQTVAQQTATQQVATTPATQPEAKSATPATATSPTRTQSTAAPGTVKATESTVPAQTAATPVTAQPQDHKYYVIVASLASMAEANKFIKMHPNDNLSVLKADGRIRLYSSAHNSRAEAVGACRKSGTRYAGAWVYTAK